MKKIAGIFIKSALILFIVLSVITVVRLNNESDVLKKQQETLEAQIKEKSLDVEQLRQKERADVNKEFIIKIAREKLGYKMPGEVVYYNDLVK